MDLWKLPGQRADLTGGIDNAGHIGIRETGLPQHQTAKLLMTLGVQIDLRIDLHRQDRQQATQDQEYQSR